MVEVNVAGRGAWSSIGMGSNISYYALTTPFVGQAFVSNPELNYNFEAVNSGVKSIQSACNAAGSHLVVDGVYGPLTTAAVKLLQAKFGATADGEFGPLSARACFSPSVLTTETILEIPDHYLAGLLDLESTFDPGAIGVIVTFGIDRGIAQINSISHPEVSWAQAFDVGLSVSWTANTMVAVQKTFKNWDATIAFWNNPLDAQEWATTGVAPNPQIAQYVADVLERAATF